MTAPTPESGRTDVPPPPPNPTQCDQHFIDGAWRIWCEIDLAGPCEGCPENADTTT